MSNEIDRLLGVHHAALSARAQRSTVLASNIANADTPGFQARDIDFKAALAQAFGAATANAGGASAGRMVRTSARHLDAGAAPAAAIANAALVYRTVSQASIDNNTVDVNVERAQFADNAMRYEASLTFVNAKIKAMLAAIQP